MARCEVCSGCSVFLDLGKVVFAVGALVAGNSWAIAAGVDPQLVAKGLTRPPKQPDAQVDLVEAEEVANCVGSYETRGGVRGLLISSGKGQPLRWLADTNGDGKIDQLSFYKDGVEAYRDMDTDFDDKIDQSRWLGMSGMRWGIDRDQDGKLDQWKIISAEEATYEVVEAIRTGDAERFRKLLLTAEELTGLGLGAEKAKAVSERVATAASDFAKLSSSQKVVDPAARWASFGADKPGIVPAGTDDSIADIVAYENAIAVVETTAGPQQVMIGTLVKSGDCWRLIDVPRLATDGATMNEGGIFFASTTSARMALGAGNAGVLSADMEKLVRELEAVEKRLMEGQAEDKPGLHAQKAEVLVKLIGISSTRDDAQAWTRQLADQIQSAVQAGEYPEGIQRLKKLEAEVEKNANVSSEVPYIAYRALTAEYSLAVSEKDADYEKVQKNHLARLEEFVKLYPESPDAADAMIQLGLNSELTNDLKTAEQWYTRATTSFPKTPQGEKARGAVQRLNLKGQRLALAGKTLQGKDFTSEKLNRPILVHYWASWCVPCQADMKEIKKLQTKYARNGLVIVGVNADNSPEQAAKFLKENTSVDWIQLHEKGGLDSRLAVGLGVFSLPVTIILDKTGKVVEASSHYTPNMEMAIQDLLK
jgi:thiol-disulfide isomerase/thioredoxin